MCFSEGMVSYNGLFLKTECRRLLIPNTNQIYIFVEYNSCNLYNSCKFVDY